MSQSTGLSSSGPWWQLSPFSDPLHPLTLLQLPWAPPSALTSHQLRPCPRSMWAWEPRARSHVPKACCLGPHTPPRAPSLCLFSKMAQKSGFSQRQTPRQSQARRILLGKMPEKETRREPGKAGQAAGLPAGLTQWGGAERWWLDGQEPGGFGNTPAGEPWRQSGLRRKGSPSNGVDLRTPGALGPWWGAAHRDRGHRANTGTDS